MTRWSLVWCASQHALAPSSRPPGSQTADFSPSLMAVRPGLSNSDKFLRDRWVACVFPLMELDRSWKAVTWVLRAPQLALRSHLVAFSVCLASLGVAFARDVSWTTRPFDSPDSSFSFCINMVMTKAPVFSCVKQPLPPSSASAYPELQTRKPEQSF